MRVPPWEGSWQGRIAERLAARGFSTISAFADSQPQATHRALAAQLAEEVDAGGGTLAGDIAPVQVLWALLDEAKAARDVERRSRDLFARDLRCALPDGWPPREPPEAGDALIGALVSWSGGIVTHLTEYEATVNAVEDALLADDTIPVGWLPASADDPLLIDLFRRYWREPPATQRASGR